MVSLKTYGNEGSSKYPDQSGTKYETADHVVFAILLFLWISFNVWFFLVSRKLQTLVVRELEETDKKWVGKPTLKNEDGSYLECGSVNYKCWKDDRQIIESQLAMLEHPDEDVIKSVMLRRQKLLEG